MRSEVHIEHGSRDYQAETIPNADRISIETIVNLLVKKGICTSDELFRLEQRLNGEKGYSNHIERKTNFNEIANGEMTFINVNNPYDRGRFPALKRSMSRHRWSRKLGTFIFGWKWKKVKKTSTE